ncbi:carbohydrate ABC transporter membrane protein 1, CUT1 family [Halanaerobium kushneri]|uniref:Carbohydrate ABC transporter membrane protein 1, CUT1 family n=1 Tax=Halanaerobium kushneri TaxID=56779 RepID=A0A1N7B125_9FIRM|nr:carbohydrate ABC transporter membrane protein 1, CUT1 family [Halanaerobium kushneri]
MLLTFSLEVETIKFKNDNKVIFFFLLPALLFWSIFLFYPIIRSLYKTFFFTVHNINPEFIGFGNYIKLLTDPVVWLATKNTFIFMIAAVIFQVGLGVLLAIFVDLIRYGKNFFRTTFFFPIVLSAASLGLLFRLLYNYDAGLLNSILEALNFEPVLWLDAAKALAMVMIPTIWQYVGFYFVIILTALTKIPNSLYEVAKIEGASTFQRITKITLPLIFQDIRVCIVLAITGTLKVFDMVWVITAGGPFDSSQVLGTYMYSTVFQRRLFGYGSTIAIFIIILGVIVTTLTNKFIGNRDVTID